MRVEDEKAEESEPEPVPVPTKRSKPVQQTPATEPAKKRQKPEPKKPKVERVDETESEESPDKANAKRTTPKPAAHRAEQLVMTHQPEPAAILNTAGQQPTVGDAMSASRAESKAINPFTLTAEEKGEKVQTSNDTKNSAEAKQDDGKNKPFDAD